MRYLITGITGFVGPHLANLLFAHGHQVAGLVRSSNGREVDILDVVPDENFRRIQFFYGDLLNFDALDRLFAKETFDGVFHLAAQSHPPTSFADPMGTFNTNSQGTLNLAEALFKHQPECRFMFCSTSEVYGVVEAKQVDESAQINPVNPYGASKAAMDIYLRIRAKSAGLPIFVTRAFSHTGPRRGKNFSVSSDAHQIALIKQGRQEPVIRVGNLESRRAVIDVRDCVEAYYLLMQKFKPGEAYNVGGSTPYSMGELLDKMIEIAGLNGHVKKTVDPKLLRPIDIPIQICDSTKCRNLTGWRPKIKLEQTLSDLIDYWARKNIRTRDFTSASISNKKINIVMPMAGLGSRFIKAGITTPKPLIEVHGKPMFKWAAESLPFARAKDFIFIMRQEHVNSHHLDEKVQKAFPGSRIVIIDEVTEGAACTVLKAKDLINNEDPLIITDCDYFWRSSHYNQTATNVPQGVKGVIPIIEAEGDKWSFTRVDENWTALQVAEKVRISKYVNFGAYFFTRGEDFVWAAEKMISEGKRVNNEFYVAPVYQELIDRGDTIKTVLLDEAWTIGTPESVKYFEEHYKGE